MHIETLSQFIKALQKSLSKNVHLNEFLVNITGGNIRAAIGLITGIIGNPNVEAEKIIRMSANGNYIIPLHEFAKSALLGDYAHYHPDTSIAMNIFDVASPDKKEHFLVPILIGYLSQFGEHLNNDGFCLSEKIFEELQSYGFTVSQIGAALRRTANKKLIETSQRVTFEEDVNGEL